MLPSFASLRLCSTGAYEKRRREESTLLYSSINFGPKQQSDSLGHTAFRREKRSRLMGRRQAMLPIAELAIALYCYQLLRRKGVHPTHKKERWEMPFLILDLLPLYRAEPRIELQQLDAVSSKDNPAQFEEKMLVIAETVVKEHIDRLCVEPGDLDESEIDSTIALIKEYLQHPSNPYQHCYLSETKWTDLHQLSTPDNNIPVVFIMTRPADTNDSELMPRIQGIFTDPFYSREHSGSGYRMLQELQVLGDFVVEPRMDLVSYDQWIVTLRRTNRAYKYDGGNGDGVVKH